MVTFHEALNIATGPLRPVESAFTMRYNSVLNLWEPPDGERVMLVMRSSLLQFQQSRRLRDLEDALEDEEERVAAIPVGCLIGYEGGEELLDEYERLGRVLEEARKREKKATQNLQYLQLQREGVPWRRPEREQLRRAFRALPQGSLVHLAGRGWAIYLGRGLGAVIGLFLQVGEQGTEVDEVLPLTEYRAIDFLPDDPVVAKLPQALTTLAVSPTVPLDQMATPEELVELRESLAEAFAFLPDLEAWKAEYRSTLSEQMEGVTQKAQARVDEIRAEIREAAEAERKHPCHACNVRSEHRAYRRQRARLLIDRDNAERRLNERRKFEETRLQNTLKGLTNVLVQFSYIRKGELTYKAKKLSDIFDTNALMITEMIEGNYLERLQPEDIAEVFSWFAYDRDIDFLNRLLLPRYLVNLRRELDDLQNAIFAAERRNEISLTRGYNPYFFGAARAWCKGTSIADLLEQVDISEGDLVTAFNKTLDLMRQVRDMFVHHDPENPLLSQVEEADRMMRRGVVQMAYTLGFAASDDNADQPTSHH
jgi:ATP-dependent RNA helicase HelY